MSRLPPLPDRASIPEHEWPLYDAVKARQASLWKDAEYDSNAYFGALLNSPPLASALAELGKVVRQSQLRGSFSDAEREFVDMLYSAEFDYWTIGLLHLADALACGVRLEAIEAFANGREDQLTAAEAQLADMVRRIISGRMTDESYAALQARFGQRGAVEFTGFVGFLQCTFRLWQALGVPDIGREAFKAGVARYRAGEMVLPPAEARQG